MFNNFFYKELIYIFLTIFVQHNVSNKFKMNSLQVFLGMVGPWQVIVIVAIILLLFGGKKIPELMKGLGSGIKEFKDATKEESSQASSKSNNQNDTTKSE